jgi:hypothetical protein
VVCKPVHSSAENKLGCYVVLQTQDDMATVIIDGVLFHWDLTKGKLAICHI